MTPIRSLRICCLVLALPAVAAAEPARGGFLGGPPRARDVERRVAPAAARVPSAAVNAALHDAETALRAALERDRARHGDMHPEVARDLRYMAALYRAHDRSPEAEAFIRWAIDVLTELQGPFSLEVADNVIFHADLCYDDERLSEADTLYRQALTIREQVLGPTHPAVAEVLDHYAILQRRQGDLRGALKSEERAREIRAEHAAVLMDWSQP